ncbi:hypothetical protein B0H12DRAFT_1117036 [Mycena haematopus]|nr:hypothetical protein B0H12DRAFT_1117036 [Mycena haematopus]
MAGSCGKGQRSVRISGYFFALLDHKFSKKTKTLLDGLTRKTSSGPSRGTFEVTAMDRMRSSLWPGMSKF